LAVFHLGHLFFLRSDYDHCVVCLKTDGTTTGEEGAYLPQLAAISSPCWRDRVDDGSMGQRDMWWRDKLHVLPHKLMSRWGPGQVDVVTGQT